MIVASLRGKSKYAKRFSNRAFDDDSRHDKRRTQEDELTSLIFGDARYLDNASAFELFRAMLGAAGLGHLLAEDCREVRIDFWELNDGTEPDVIVELSAAGKATFLLLIEVKWNAGQGDDQLRRELRWRKRSNDKVCDALIFLVRHGKHGAADTSALKSGGVGYLTWFELSEIFQAKFQQSSASSSSQWFHDHCHFLRQLGIKPFRGFQNTSLVKWRAEERDSAVCLLFRRFQGFAKLKSTEIRYLTSERPLFWKVHANGY